MKKYSFILTAIAVLVGASCGRTVNTSKKLKTGLDSFSYTIGINLGRGMKQQGLEKLDYSSLIKGIEDALKKDSGFAINMDDAEKIQRGFMMREQSKKIKKFQEESKKWMLENAKKSGITALASGGQILIAEKGTGPAPQVFDTIEYSMVMKNSKGKVLRDSEKMGGSPKHSLKQIGLAQLEEAFQKIGAGAKFTVFLQNDLVPELGGMSESFEDRYGITIMEFHLKRIIPGKPEPEKKPDAPKTNIPEIK